MLNWPNEECVREWSRRLDFNPWSSHTKDSKMVPNATLLNIQHYKVWIKSKVEQSREWSSPPPHTHRGVVAIEKGAFGSPSTKVANFTLYIYIYIYINGFGIK